MKRWTLYLLVGLIFGIFDFYYQEMTKGLLHSTLSWLSIAWIVWLIPVIPIILHELKISKSIIKSALANVVTWATATIIYYLYIPFKLIFIGQASRSEMYFTNHGEDYYWDNVKYVFQHDVFGGIGRWIGVATIGGFIFGLLFSIIILRFKKKGRLE